MSNNSTINQALEKLDKNNREGLCELLDITLESEMDKVLNFLQLMDSKNEARFNAIESKFDAKFDAIEHKFDAIESKFDAKFDAVNHKINGIYWFIASAIAIVPIAYGVISYLQSHS